jgi:RNA polymerase sigma factor (sigma-70 family)
MTNVELNAAITIRQSPFFASEHAIENQKETQGRVKEIYPDSEIIAGLQSQNQVIIKYIYKKYFQQIRFMVSSNSGSQMDAEDVFQDALVIIFQKIRSGELRLVCAFSTYLYAICRNIWLQKLDKHASHLEYKDYMDLDNLEDTQNTESHYEDNERFKLFQQHFLQLNEDDQKVLKLFLKKIPLAEIATIMGYKSYAYAKVRKYICKEKLKNSILCDPRYQAMVRNGLLTPFFQS